MSDGKAPDAFRTISEAAEDLELPQHVLRFWETRFPQIKPLKRGGGRRYYRPDDLDFLRGLKHLLHEQRYTIKGVQKIIKDHGAKGVQRTLKEVGPFALPAASSTMAIATSMKDTTTTASASVINHGSVPDGARSRLLTALEELLACRRIIADFHSA